MSPPVTCDFCKASGEDEITGEMQRTPDRTIVAHYNCMLYSPQVFSIDLEEDEEGFSFDIESVQSEIERGQKLRCNICRKAGATAGCDVSSCPKKYHYPCVQKANGSSSPNGYVVYCKDHKSKNTANGSKDTGGKTKNRMSRSPANQTIIWEDCSEVGDGCKRRTVIRTSGKYIGHKDVYYLSPKGEKFRSKKKLQRHMDESMGPSSSKSKDRRTQSPAEKGEGIQTRRRMPPPRTALKHSRQSKTRIHQNNGTKAGDAVSGRTDVNVNDKATGSNSSEIEKTPETEPRKNVRVNLQRLHAEKHYTSEQPASPQGALSTQLNAVPQVSSRQFGDSRKCSLRSGKAASKTRHLACRNCREPLPDMYEDILCRDCLQEESGAPSTQLNPAPKMSSQQYEDSRRCSLRSDKALSKRKHRTCGNCKEPLPDNYEGMLCRDCPQEESGKNGKTQWNSCRNQYSQKLTDQRKSHDVPPKKRPYILQDEDLPASIDSLDDSEEKGEGDGGNSDVSQIDHPNADTPTADITYSPQSTPDQTSEPATSSMVSISAQAGTCNGDDVAAAAAPEPNNDSQVLQNLTKSAHVDPEESFLQSLTPYLHKIPITRRLKVKGAFMVMLEAAMSQKKSQSLFQAINLWHLKNEGPADGDL